MDTREMRLTASVTGRVQGVGYRYFTQSAATHLGLKGWCRNEYDGSVYVVAEGTPEQLDALVVRLQTGPPGGRVDGIQVNRTEATGEFSGFSIR